MIVLRDLSKSFDGGKRFAVHALSLAVEDEIVMSNVARGLQRRRKTKARVAQARTAERQATCTCASRYHPTPSLNAGTTTCT